jgi:hypothetical protein
MRLAVILFASALGGTGVAQTANDDTTSTENWWDKVGAGFFSDEGLTTLRSEFEIRAHWTGLSQDDQSAVRARCDELTGEGPGTAPSLQEGDEDENPDTTEAERRDIPEASMQNDASDDTGNAATTTTGSVEGEERQIAKPAADGATETGLAGSTDGNLARICDLIRTL